MGAGPGDKRRLEGHSGRAESKHRLDPGAGELRGIISESWRGCQELLFSARFELIAKGGLSAQSNIPTLPLPSSLPGLI